MKTNDVLRWGVIGGILVTCFVPLIVANDLFFPFITGKAFTFRIAVEIVVALWLILALRDPSVRPKKSLLLYLLGAFLLSLGVSVALSANPDKSFWSNFERMEGWIGIAHLAAYLVVVFSVFVKEEYWKWLWNTTIAVSVIEALYGVFQLAGWLQIHQGGVRLDGTFGNAIYLAIYMVMCFFLTLLAWLWWARGGNRWLQGAYAVALFLQVVIVFYTATRGAILGLVAGVFVAGLVFLFSSGRKALWHWGIGAIVVLALAYGAFLAVDTMPSIQNHEVLSRLASIDTPQKLLAQGSTRFAIWEMAWKGFLDRPLFGWGQESFNYVFNEYYQPSLYAQEQWFDRAHNEFLDVLVAGGAIGFLWYVSLFGASLWYLFRPQNAFTGAERGVLTGLLAAYVVNDLFVFDNLMSYVLFFTVLAYLAYRGTARQVAPLVGRNTPVKPETANIVTPIIILVMCAVAYFANVPGVMAASDLIQALSPQGDPSTNLDLFRKTVADAGGGGLGLQEVREQLLEFATRVESAHAGTDQFRSELSAYAVSQMRSQITASPRDARLRLLLGIYLLQSGDTGGAREELTAAEELSPQKQRILFALGTLETVAQNYPAALEWFRKAYELYPADDEARIDYAACAIEAGDRTLASSLLLPRFGTTTPDDDTILRAYLSAKSYADALAIARARIMKDPANAVSHEQLAIVYLAAGDRADAVLEFQEAIKLDPSFSAQGQSYIQRIQGGH